MAESGVPLTRGRVLRLAWPIILANAAVPLLGLADTAVIGNVGSVADLGAIAFGAVIFSFVYWGFGFLRMGTTGFTAQAAGAGDELEVRATLARPLLLAAGLVLRGIGDPNALRGPKVKVEGGLWLWQGFEDGRGRAESRGAVVGRSDGARDGAGHAVEGQSVVVVVWTAGAGVEADHRRWYPALGGPACGCSQACWPPRHMWPRRPPWCHSV